jgi:hypothetical protein
MKFTTSTITLTALFLPLVYCQVECPGAPSDADCETCLGAGCVTAVGECRSDCSFIADASCYSVRDNSTTVEEVCARKAANEADAALCGKNGAVHYSGWLARSESSNPLVSL